MCLLGCLVNFNMKALPRNPMWTTNIGFLDLHFSLKESKFLVTTPSTLSGKCTKTSLLPNCLWTNVKRTLLPFVVSTTSNFTILYGSFSFRSLTLMKVGVSLITLLIWLQSSSDEGYKQMYWLNNVVTLQSDFQNITYFFFIFISITDITWFFRLLRRLLCFLNVTKFNVNMLKVLKSCYNAKQKQLSLQQHLLSFPPHHLHHCWLSSSSKFLPPERLTPKSSCIFD